MNKPKIDRSKAVEQLVEAWDCLRRQAIPVEIVDGKLTVGATPRTDDLKQSPYEAIGWFISEAAHLQASGKQIASEPIDGLLARYRKFKADN